MTDRMPVDYEGGMDEEAHSPDPVDSPFFPLNKKWFWLVWCPLCWLWLFLHWQSFAILFGTIAAVGPVVAGVLSGIRMRDWRFIAMGLAYAVWIYWMGIGWLWQ